MSARGPSLSQMSHSVSSQMTRQGKDCGKVCLLPRIQVPPITRIRSSFFGALAIGCQALLIYLTFSNFKGAWRTEFVSKHALIPSLLCVESRFHGQGAGTSMTRFKIGETVEKTRSGVGTIRAIFTTIDGEHC
jgi:hypothetical protein